jgi:hypothetical protein
MEPVERRRAPRYRFVAEAEVTDIALGTSFSAQTSDLSIGGCFVDILNPRPRGTEIRVRITHASATFTALGRVAFVVANMGMGIAFTNVNGDQVTVLQGWLLELWRMPF